MAAQMMSETDHARVAEAVRAAESRTDGEIFCVLARASDSWFAHSALAAAIATFVASVAVAILATGYFGGVNLVLFALAEALAFATLVLLLRVFPALRIALVPKRTRYRRAHDNAMRQFIARNVHRTAARTGVLIFVSVAERYAEIIADSGINARVSQETWNGLVASLVDSARRRRYADGFIAAVAEAGDLLAQHFPRGASDLNELDDHVVEL